MNKMRPLFNTIVKSTFLFFFFMVGQDWIVPSARAEEFLSAGMHPLGATDSLQTIAVEVVYYLPSDSAPLQDWRDRIDYLMKRTQKFHRREFTGQSDFTYHIYPQPFMASVPQAGFPHDDPNTFYWHIINEVWHSGKIEFPPKAFPIILVFSDHNFSPSYDDWSRVCNGVSCLFPEPHTDCAGYVNSEGEDRPGSRCGGARAVFWPEEHIGLGLVTADGWKVPLKGSDCVVYHEGIGHSIGLPHPEPINDSVMGLAQYVDTLRVAWVDEDQKLALGWNKTPVNQDNLFSTFQVKHLPQRPLQNEAIQIIATFPTKFHPKSIELEYQTALQEPFRKAEIGGCQKDENFCSYTWSLPGIASGQSIAYRVKLETDQGESDEIWNYYKVR